MSTLPNQFHVQLRRLVEEAIGSGGSLATQVATNTANIATNSGNISTNTADISTNAAAIAANTAAIAALSTAGWASYANDAADSTVLSEVWVDVPCNKSSSVTTYLPSGVTSLVDGSGYFDLSELTVGDFVIICPDVYLNTTVINAVAKFRYTYGVAETREFVYRFDMGCNYGLKPNLNLVLPVDSTDTRDNPVKLQAWLSEKGSVGCNSHNVQVIES